MVTVPVSTLPLASRIRPRTVLVASADRVIPRPHSERLYAAWGGPKQWREIRLADHDSLASEPDYWRAIAAFLAKLK